MKPVSLKVSEAYSKDVGHNKARIDYESMESLGFHNGEIVEIHGKRITVSRCTPSDPSDKEKGIIRIDGITRNNAGLEKGDFIQVNNVVVSPAKEITIRPLEHDEEETQHITEIDSQYIANNLDGSPVIHADNLSVRFKGMWFVYSVVETYPTNYPVIITKETVFHIIDYVEVSSRKSEKEEPVEDPVEDPVEEPVENLVSQNLDSWVYHCLEDAKSIIRKHHTDYDTVEFFANTTYKLFAQTDMKNAYGYTVIEPNSNHFNIGIHQILLERNRQNERMLVIILVHELLHAIHDREGWEHDKINPLERKLANLAGYFDALIEMENLAISGRMHFCNE